MIKMVDCKGMKAIRVMLPPDKSKFELLKQEIRLIMKPCPPFYFDLHDNYFHVIHPSDIPNWALKDLIQVFEKYHLSYKECYIEIMTK